MQRITGLGVEEIGSSLSWYTVKAILEHLSLDSALARELHREYVVWDSTLKTNFLLADIIDLLQAIDYHLVSMTGTRAQKPKPYPRPNEKKDKRHIGKGAMKVDDLKKWIFKKSN